MTTENCTTAIAKTVENSLKNTWKERERSFNKLMILMLKKHKGIRDGSKEGARGLVALLLRIVAFEIFDLLLKIFLSMTPAFWISLGDFLVFATFPPLSKFLGLPLGNDIAGLKWFMSWKMLPQAMYFERTIGGFQVYFFYFLGGSFFGGGEGCNFCSWYLEGPERSARYF